MPPEVQGLFSTCPFVVFTWPLAPFDFLLCCNPCTCCCECIYVCCIQCPINTVCTCIGIPLTPFIILGLIIQAILVTIVLIIIAGILYILGLFATYIGLQLSLPIFLELLLLILAGPFAIFFVIFWIAVGIGACCVL